MRNFMQIVNPEINRGRPPRDITRADLVWAPVKNPGTFNLGDMLNQQSIGNLFEAYNRCESVKAKKLAIKRAAHKR